MFKKSYTTVKLQIANIWLSTARLYLMYKKLYQTSTVIYAVYSNKLSFSLAHVCQAIM